MNYFSITEDHDCPVCSQYALLRDVVDHNDQSKAERLLSSNLMQCRQIREKIEGHKQDQVTNMTWLLVLIAAVTTILAVGAQQLFL
ncbi:MAG: hypothetical protein WBB45_00460 [Cyclobacteriaceae bacterium]